MQPRQSPRLFNGIVRLALLATTTTLLATASACSGGFPQDGQQASIQELLHRTADGAPDGQTTYWLGPTFDGARISTASAGWKPYASITYVRRGSANSGLVFEVRSYVSLAPPNAQPRSETRIHVGNGQEVTVFFHIPLIPSATLRREVRDALKPLPANVTYSQ